MAGQKYLQIDPSTGNKVIQGTSVQTSAGAGDSTKIPALNGSGVLDSTIVNSVVTSAGAGSSGQLVALDSSGLISSTMMPVGIGADTQTGTTSEALSSGNMVNFDSGGLVRKADASNGRDAQGFVLSSVSNGGTATVYLSGKITGLSSLTIGAQYFLNDAGAGGAVSTAPTTAGHLWQPIGTAISATVIEFRRHPPITL